jgi:hypothetical protein
MKIIINFINRAAIICIIPLGSCAALAIVLACLGLFGLAAFTTVQRTKEVV